jgi:hypothetical protein
MHVMGCVVQIAAEVSTWQSLSEHQNEEPETTQILLIQLPHSVGKGICGNEWRMGGIDAFSDDGVSSDVFAVFFS